MDVDVDVGVVWRKMLDCKAWQAKVLLTEDIVKEQSERMRQGL